MQFILNINISTPPMKSESEKLLAYKTTSSEDEPDIVYDSDKDLEYLPINCDGSVQNETISLTPDDIFSTLMVTPNTLVVKNTLVPSVKQKRCQLINKDNLTRKRIKNSSEWIDIKSKRKLNLGEEHINRGGKLIMAKKMGPPCMEKCQMKCREKLNDEDRKIIFDSYLSLSSHMRQRDFISSNTQIMSKKSSTAFNTSEVISDKIVTNICTKLKTSPILPEDLNVNQL
ncbi:hypothetical protein QTP88_026346 [Uroleucon formosanum]